MTAESKGLINRATDAKVRYPSPPAAAAAAATLYLSGELAIHIETVSGGGGRWTKPKGEGIKSRNRNAVHAAAV